MNKSIAIVFAAFVLAPIVCWGQEQMTVARFREITSTPGDNTPLNPKLAAAISDLFTNATVSIVLKYPDGKTLNVEATESAKTVGGKYIVTTVHSQSNSEHVDSIMTYDEKASAYRGWAAYGEKIIGGVSVFDLQKKIVSTYVDYGDGSSELSVGSYSNTESSDRALIFKNGVLFCTRESKTMPVNKSK